MEDALKQNFRFWRQSGRLTAAAAIAAARRDIEAGKARYPRTPGVARIGAAFTAGSTELRWVEDPADFGLRFIGFADELAGRAVDHFGWLTDEDGVGATLRGAVYQLPARDGQPLYVPGCREGSYNRGSRTWCDTSTGDDSGAAAVAFGEIIRSGETDWRTADDKRDAAMRADRIAEITAESEREYNSAWQAGARFADMGELIATCRTAALELLAEMRAERRAGEAERPAICAALRNSISDMLRQIAAARAERAKLREEWSGGRMWSGWERLQAAFNEGAGESVVA